jgi:hypothetical protein
MNEQGYPVEWRGRKFVASDLTDELKERYCAWLYNHLLDNARARKSASDYLRYENRLTAAPPEWTSLPDDATLASLDKLPGRRQLLRLILSLKPETDPDGMSDAEMDELIREKEADPGSDLKRAMNLIRDRADPKAKRAGGGSPARTDESAPTPPSATTPSASSETKSPS